MPMFRSPVRSWRCSEQPFVFEWLMEIFSDGRSVILMGRFDHSHLVENSIGRIARINVTLRVTHLTDRGSSARGPVRSLPQINDTGSPPSWGRPNGSGDHLDNFAGGGRWRNWRAVLLETLEV